MTNIVTVSTIAALRTYSAAGSASPVIWVQGYTGPADGGEGMFLYVPSDTTSADNGGTIIIATVGSSQYRYYRQYNKDALNICWFGAALNAASDSSAALNAALAALPSGGGKIYFPAGTLTFASTISYTIPTSSVFSLTLFGDGADASQLYWPATSGISVLASQGVHTFHCRDLSILTGQPCKYTGITVKQTDAASGDTGSPLYQNDFVRLTVRGNTASNYWAAGIAIDGLSNVVYDTLTFYGGANSGTGVTITCSSKDSSGNQEYAIVHNFDKCSFFEGGVGINYGAYSQGITVSQCNFTNIQTGILTPVQTTGQFQLAVIGSQFQCSEYAINISGTLAAISIIGNLFFVPNTPISGGGYYAGIYFTTYTSYTSIVGNQFLGTIPASGVPVGYGVLAEQVAPGTASSFRAVVSGNAFSSLHYGVYLVSTDQWNVQANIYDNGAGSQVTTPVTASGSNSIGVATQ